MWRFRGQPQRLAMGSTIALALRRSANGTVTTSSSASSSPAAATAGRADVPHVGTPVAHHKKSENIADAASLIGEDVPFSFLGNLAVKMLHARRLMLPVAIGAATSALLPIVSASIALSTMHHVTLGCLLAILQRLSVRGAVNTVQKDLTGVVCVVSGGTSGLGLATVQQLAAMGATVCIVARSGKEAATKAALKAAQVPPEWVDTRVSFVAADFMDQTSVATAVQRVKGMFPSGIHIVVNCAAVLKEDSVVSKQGIEEHIAVNFLAPYHLTEGLLPLVQKTPAGRVVYVTCSAHHGVRKGNVVRDRLNVLPRPEESQVTARCYSASKLGNIMHARYLASRRYDGVVFQKGKSQSAKHQGPQPFTACTVDPGPCATNLSQPEDPLLGNGTLGKLIRSLWLKDPVEGSQSIVNCCLRDDLENGGHYYECRLMPNGVSRMANSPKEMNEVCRWAQQRVERYLRPQ